MTVIVTLAIGTFAVTLPYILVAGIIRPAIIARVAVGAVVTVAVYMGVAAVVGLP